MSRQIKTVAIIGGGPAGGALGALLAREGYKIVIYHTDKRPPLVVGESLLPAVVPMLQRLGIEDEVKSFSIYKPGATVCLKVDEIIPFKFVWGDRKLPHYAYNTQRDLFDLAVLNAAEKAGAKIVRTAAKLEKDSAPNAVRLSKETLDRAEGSLGEKPDLIVDASGRSRVLSRLLDGPVTQGGRHDVALFAHLSKAFITDEGHIHTDYLTRGWSWRIPLPGKVSLGVVIDPKHLEKYGADVQSQYDGYIAEEPSLKRYTEGAKRLTPVVKYQNYQLISTRMHGPGWAMVGDAAGFIDPIFSTGLYLGMKGAFELFHALHEGGATERAMNRYEQGRHRELKLWQRVIHSWYSGRLFNLYRAGQMHNDGPVGRFIERRVQKRIVSIFTGQAVSKMTFSMNLIGVMMKFGERLRSPADLAVS
jgi:flavin-dependent dehydrogenase